jgi:hypothetical protein
MIIQLLFPPSTVRSDFAISVEDIGFRIKSCLHIFDFTKSSTKLSRRWDYILVQINLLTQKALEMETPLTRTDSQ